MIGGLADHHAGAVVDEEAAADGGAGVDLDLGEEAADLRDHARQQRDAPAIELVREAVRQDGVEARIAEEDLDDALGRRVFPENGVDLLPDGSKTCRVPMDAARRGRDSLVLGDLFRGDLNAAVGARRHRGEHVFFPLDQRGGVVAGGLEAVAVGDGVGGAGLHAVPAENAAVVIDVVDAGVALAAGDARLCRCFPRPRCRCSWPGRRPRRGSRRRTFPSR